MAQGRLIRAAAAAGLFAFGAAAEAAAPSASAPDFVVGAALGCAGAWQLRRSPPLFVTALAWFAGTLATPLLLLYRGPLLQLLLGLGGPPSRRDRALAAAGWIAALLPLPAAGPATAAAAACVAATVLMRGGAADQRRVRPAAGAAAAVLAALWALAAAGVGSADSLTLLNDAAVLAVGALAVTVATGTWTRGAASALVVRPGRRGTDRPITAQLARVLADPELEIRYALPGVGWVDEAGGRSRRRRAPRSHAPMRREEARSRSSTTPPPLAN